MWHPTHHGAMRKRAFSLVELSIVLVILGLLTGGILAGKSLIRASELRAVGTEYQRYLTATQAFREKYLEIPGDMSAATSFWGKDATYCNSDTGTATSNGTCNGNGDKVITVGSGGNATAERTQFWKQLMLAGMVEGSYTGVTGVLSNVDQTAGINIPGSKFPQGGWGAGNTTIAANQANYFFGSYGNFFVFSARTPSNGGTTASLLKPEEAWNIDTKVDDGRPYGGKLYSNNWNNLCALASSNQDSTATYNLADSTVQCMFYFVRQF